MIKANFGRAIKQRKSIAPLEWYFGSKMVLMLIPAPAERNLDSIKEDEYQSAPEERYIGRPLGIKINTAP